MPPSPTPLQILQMNFDATRLTDAKYEDMLLKTRDDNSTVVDEKTFCLLSKLHTTMSQLRWDVMWRVTSDANYDLRCLIKQQLITCHGIQQWIAAGANLPACETTPLDPWAIIPRTKVRYLDFMLPDVSWISATRLADNLAINGPGTQPNPDCYVVDVRYLNGQNPGGFIAVEPIAVSLHTPFWFKIWIDEATGVEYRIEEYTADSALLRVIAADPSAWHQIGSTGKWWADERWFHDVPTGWTSQLTNDAPDTTPISASVFDTGHLNSTEFCPDPE